MAPRKASLQGGFIFVSFILKNVSRRSSLRNIFQTVGHDLFVGTYWHFWIKEKNQNRKHHLWFGGHGVPRDSGAQSLFSRGNSLRRILSPMFVRIWSFRSKTLFQSKLHRNGDLSAELLPRPKYSDRSEIDHIWMWGLVLQKDSPEEMSLKRGWGGDQVQGQGSPPMKGRKCIGWNCWHLAIFDLQKWQSLVLKLKGGLARTWRLSWERISFGTSLWVGMALVGDNWERD